jgi:thymidylate synthase ThyX
MTFFLAGISRRVSHELIRHYVGADRSEEGSPSQESTRYTFHPGHFAVPPYVIARGLSAATGFHQAMESAYSNYLAFINREETLWESAHGKKPTAIDRKRIYEAAAGLLPMQACTSMVWTTNPLALSKLFSERCSEAADAEFQRFALKWRAVAEARWPNLFRARP